VRGSEAGKPWTLKSGGLEPRSLTEVYAYVYLSFDWKFFAGDNIVRTYA